MPEVPLALLLDPVSPGCHLESFHPMLKNLIDSLQEGAKKKHLLSHCQDEADVTTEWKLMAKAGIIQ